MLGQAGHTVLTSTRRRSWGSDVPGVPTWRWLPGCSQPQPPLLEGRARLRMMRCWVWLQGAPLQSSRGRLAGHAGCALGPAPGHCPLVLLLLQVVPQVRLAIVVL